MSEGTRCDGCKEMIRKDGPDFLQLTVQRKPDPEDGRSSYHQPVSTKHFHNRHCLQEWVCAIGWWDEAFADSVSDSQPPKLPILVGASDGQGDADV